MPTLERKTGCISYDVHGEGEPVVILRGLGRTVRHWLGYERALARHFKVVTMDLRGIGDTTAPCDWTTSLFEIADDLAAVLDALAIDRAHVLGVSLGGMVTLAMGMAHPERCASLVTVNTSIAGIGTMRITPAALRAILTGVTNKAAMQTALVDVLVGPQCPQDRRDEIARAYAEIEAEIGLYPVTVLKQLVGAARFHVKARLSEMRVPTLVVYGTEDRFVPNVNSRKIAKILPNAKLLPIQGAGHEVTLDRAEELTAAAVDWVHAVSRQQKSG